MIRQPVTKTAESLLEQLSRIFPKIGSARSAESGKRTSSRKSRRDAPSHGKGGAREKTCAPPCLSGRHRQRHYPHTLPPPSEAAPVGAEASVRDAAPAGAEAFAGEAAPVGAEPPETS